METRDMELLLNFGSVYKINNFIAKNNLKFTVPCGGDMRATLLHELIITPS